MKRQRLVRLDRFALLIASTSLASALAHAQTPLLERTGHAAGDLFGWSLAFVGDVDGDGYSDLAIGAPLNDSAGTNAGQVEVFSGRDGHLLRTWNGLATDVNFGVSIAGVGDVDGDGKDDVLVGSGTWLGPLFTLPLGPVRPGYARLISGASGTVIHHFVAPIGSSNFGYAVASGADIDGDAVSDLWIGAPGDYSDGGYVYLYSGATGAQIRRDSAPTGRNFGMSIVVLGDVNGDATVEYAAGAPFALNTGSFPNQTSGFVYAIDSTTGALVWQHALGGLGQQQGWSLARVGDLTGDGVDEIVAGGRGGSGGASVCPFNNGVVRVLNGRTGGVVRSHAGLFACGAYGSSTVSLGDLDGDGFDEYAGGEPGWEPWYDGCARLRVFSGASGALVTTLDPPGYPVPINGWSFALASGDANGDGLHDLIISAPWFDTNGPDDGLVQIYTIVRSVKSYCDSEANSLGCTPSITGIGIPSATSASAFDVRATGVLNNKSGLLFYSFKPRETPFQGGHMCVVWPTQRTPVQNSAGTAPPASDCSGVFSLDFNARIQSGVDPLLVVGEEVFAQYWSRDPQDASTTNLTDALAFYVNP